MTISFTELATQIYNEAYKYCDNIIAFRINKIDEICAWLIERYSFGESIEFNDELVSEWIFSKNDYIKKSYIYLSFDNESNEKVIKHITDLVKKEKEKEND